MRTTTHGIRTVLLRILVAAALSGMTGFARAEVSVMLQSPQAEPSGPLLGGLIDSSDPVTSVLWRPFGGNSPNRFVLNGDGETNGDLAPSLLYDPISRLPIVAWAKNMGAHFDVVVSRFENGAWTEPEALTDSLADEIDPYLFLDPADGTVHVVYTVDDGTPHVVHRQAPADLSSWTAPLQVSQPAEIAVRPSGVVHLGLLTVAYEAHTLYPGGTPRQVILATWTGASFSSQVLASTGCEEPNWPEVHSGLGRLWVDWIDGTGQMAWRKESSPGTFDPTEVETFSGPEERDYHVRGKIRGLVFE